MVARSKDVKPNPQTIRGRMQLSKNRDRLQISGERIPLGVVITFETVGSRYDLTRINDTEWVIVGSARFPRPTLCFPHDGVIQPGEAFIVGCQDGREVTTAPVARTPTMAKAPKRAAELIEQAQSAEYSAGEKEDERV